MSSKTSLTVDTEEEQFELFRAIARGEPITNPGQPRRNFIPLLKHPLPLSDHRHLHQSNLRRILSCKLEMQAFGAISQGDAWTLEEVFMRGAPVDCKDRNGFTPLHMAVQRNHLESVMVLLNIGVDVNATSLSGYTPLYIATGIGAENLIQVLQENGAKMYVDNIEDPPKSILDVEMHSEHSSVEHLNKHLGIPSTRFQY